MMLYVVRGRRVGFTLIEIMIVIAVIAILAGIVVPNIVMARFEAGLTACQENCKTALEAVQMARVRHSWQETANMLGLGCSVMSVRPGSSDGEVVEVSGVIGDKFVDSGYLAKLLRCEVSGGLLYYWYCIGDWSGCFYVDWQRTQELPCPGYANSVGCWEGDGHFYDGISVFSCYDESLGACFW